MKTQNKPANGQSFQNLLRFALADHAFREADALALHIIESKIPTESHLFSAAVAGVVVCYCRPFMSAKWLGPLPDDMQQFSGAENEATLQEIHESLFEARHKLAAHFDRQHSEEMFNVGKISLPPSEVIIDLQPNGYLISTNAAYLSPERLPLARYLFEIQIDRVRKRIEPFVDELRKQKKLGKCVFRVPCKTPVNR